MRNILIASPEFLFPCNHGRVIDIYTRIKALLQAGNRVDFLFCGKQYNPKVVQQLQLIGINRVYFAKKQASLWSFITAKSFQSYARRQLAKVKLVSKYDYVILESIFVEYLLKNPTLAVDKTILRVHNDEAKYAKQLSLSANNWIKKLAFHLEAKFIQPAQARVFNQVNSLWFISQQEKAAYNGNTKAYFVPPYIEKIQLVNEAEFIAREQVVLFVGNLFTDNNLSGLTWYLDQVHAKLKKIFPQYKLIIAGSSRVADPLAKYRSDSAIEVFYNLANVDFLYTKAQIFINPIFYGAGLKLKTIGAITNGVPVISTAVGFEGTALDLFPNLEEYCFAGAEKCLALISLLLAAPKHGYAILQQQQTIIQEHFCYPINNFLN
jgi:glycosyltransferase involved in cell wall biosynthesis